MSRAPRLISVLRKPWPAALAALAIVATAFAIVPLTTAAPPNPTSASDVELDAGQTVAEYFDGVYMGERAVHLFGSGPIYNHSFDLTVSNITYTNSTEMRLHDPAGTASPVTTVLSPSGCTTCNATFPNVRTGAAGMWTLRAGDGVTIVGIWVGPDHNALAVTVTPDPMSESSGNVFYTLDVRNVSGAVPNVSLRGPGIPEGATTNATGEWDYYGPSPGVGTHTIEARRQLVAQTTNGYDVPDVVVARSYTVLDENAPNLHQSDLSVTGNSTIGDPITTRVTVTNSGGGAGSGTLRLYVNGAQRESRNLTLAAGESTRPNMTFTPTVAGTYWIETRLGDSTLGPRSVYVAASAPARLSIANASGGVLGPVVVPIMLRNVTDFGSATVTLHVNPEAIAVDGVGDGSIPGANMTTSYNASSGKLTILVTTSARPGASGDFVLANVSLSAAGPVGSTSALDLGVTELVTSDGAPITWTATDGWFRVGLLGDADGDGDVDAQDVLAIADAVVGKRPMSSIVVADADVSDDGEVTGKDAMFLRQHLAGTRPTL